MTMKLKLNCDLGENAALDGHAVDEVVMPHIDQANIACGFHAGGPAVMRHTLALAAQYDVQIGAHPGYPDRKGSGAAPWPVPRQRSLPLCITRWPLWRVWHGLRDSSLNM